MFQGIFKSAINDANKNYIFGTGSIPIQIKTAQLATFADGTTKQQGYQVAEVNKLISTMLTGWDANGNKPKSMSNNYLELILSCDNGFVVKKRLQFPHIIAWQDDNTPYNIADVYKQFSIDNWLKADDFENPDITLVVEPTDEILTTSTANPPEVTTTNSGRFYLYYRNLPVGINRIHIDFHIKTKTEPIDFDLEVIDGLSWKDAQTILASNAQAKINVLLGTVKDVYNFTGAEGNFEDITMYEWSALYQQIITLNPSNKFTHNLYFYIYDDRINVIEGDLYKEVHDYQEIYELLNHTITSGYDQSIQFNLQAHVGETLYLSVSNSKQYGWYDTSFNFTRLGYGSADKKEFVVPSNAKGFWLFGEGIVTNVEVYDKSKIIIVDKITLLEQDVESIKNTLSPISHNFPQIALNTDNLCKVSASRQNIKMLVYGDSITNNAFLTIENGKTISYIETIQRTFTIDGVTYKFKNWVRLLRNYFNFADIRNYAQDGAHYITKDVQSGFERQNLQYQIDLSFADLDSTGVFGSSGNFVPDIVIFALGINDITPNDTFESAMAKSVMYSDGSGIDIDATIANLDTTKFYEAVRCAYLRIKKQFPFATVFSVLPLQIGIPDRLEYTKVLHDSIEEMANRCGVICIDGTYKSGIISDGEKNGHNSTYLVDGLHPNGSGHNLYVKMVANAIKSNFVEDVELNS